MAIIYRADISPTKQELIEGWLPDQEWAGEGPVEIVGAYRFDDPSGEVGVECHLARQGGRVLHLPLTYRGTEAPELAQHLLGTMEHSVLGRRWIYDGSADPVAVECFARAMAGEQEQAANEIHENGEMVEVREPSVRVAVAEPGQGSVEILRVVDDAPAGRGCLVASWADESGVVARLG